MRNIVCQPTSTVPYFNVLSGVSKVVVRTVVDSLFFTNNGMNSIRLQASGMNEAAISLSLWSKEREVIENSMPSASTLSREEVHGHHGR